MPRGSLGGVSDGKKGGAPNADKRIDTKAIKKMKPPELKAYLTAYGLSTQGNKKDLIARLTAAAKERHQ